MIIVYHASYVRLPLKIFKQTHAQYNMLARKYIPHHHNQYIYEESERKHQSIITTSQFLWDQILFKWLTSKFV